MQTPEARPFGEVFFGFFLLVFSVWAVWAAYQISGFGKLSDPGAIPLIGTSIMLAAAFTHAVNCLRQRHKPTNGNLFTDILPPAVIVFGVATTAYAVAMETVGFSVASVVYLAGLFWFMGKMNPLRAIGLALVTVVMIYVLFRLVFLVLLPEGIIPEREIAASIGNMLGGN